MKRIFIIFLICLAFASTHAQMDNPLKKGMPHTVTLSTGDVVYDIDGEWDAAYYSEYFGTKKDIVKITQEGNKFVGISLIGNEMASKGSDTIKGELEKGGFKSVLTNYDNFEWLSSTGEIGDKCNKMVIKALGHSGEMVIILTLTRK
jgi:hypothetical protein